MRMLSAHKLLEHSHHKNVRIVSCWRVTAGITNGFIVKNVHSETLCVYEVVCFCCLSPHGESGLK